MRHRYIALLPLLLVISSCSNQLGRSMPECDGDPTGTVIMMIQAVPETSFVPCVHALEAGWEFNDVEPRSGLAEFSIDSDRIGEPFITVHTTASCDISQANSTRSDEDDIELYKSVVEDFTVPIVIIPEGPNDETLAAAQSAASQMFGLRLHNKYLDVQVAVGGSTQERIASAHSRGSHVMTISIRDAEEDKLSLLLATESVERSGQTLDDALEVIDDGLVPPSYRGSWFYVSNGGCTEYRFDAAGPGAERVAADVQSSLGFIDAEAIKQVARQAGYNVP